MQRRTWIQRVLAVAFGAKVAHTSRIERVANGYLCVENDKPEPQTVLTVSRPDRWPTATEMESRYIHGKGFDLRVPLRPGETRYTCMVPF